jgi:hypothetical protein
MAARGGLTLVVFWAWLSGCGAPELDLPQTQAQDRVELEVQPSAPLDATPAVFRGRLRDGAALGEPWLFRDALSDYYQRALGQGELPDALVARAVPVRFWRDEADWLLQPLVPLEPGARYSVALRGHGLVDTLTVAPRALAPVPRLFPPLGSTKHAYALYCGVQLPESPFQGALEPGHVPLQISAGDAGSALDGCVELRAQGEVAEPLVGPPWLGDVPLDPAPFSPASAAVTAECQGDELAGGGCLEVLDDRVNVTQGPEAMLWVLQEPAPLLLALRAGERATLLRGLEPEQSFELRGATISAAGEATALSFSGTTRARRSHLVINEVLANALGPEPASEWVELVNDSALAVSLGGLWLEDGTGRVALPDVTLAGGELALLVPRGSMRSALDVPFAPEARVIELPTLGERGLSNSGEPLTLAGSGGVMSTFPALAASHAGKSMARRALDALDGVPESFAEHGDPGASPGGPNFFD